MGKSAGTAPVAQSPHPQQRFGQVASDPLQPGDACAETGVQRLLGIPMPENAAPEAPLCPGPAPPSCVLAPWFLDPLPSLCPSTRTHSLTYPLSSLKGTAGLPSWMASSRVDHALGPPPAEACTRPGASEGGRGETGTRGMVRGGPGFPASVPHHPSCPLSEPVSCRWCSQRGWLFEEGGLKEHRCLRAESRGCSPPPILPHWGRKHRLLHGARRLPLKV